MKPIQFYLLSLVGFVSLIFSIALVAVDQSNQTLHATAREQQAALAQAANNQQIFQNMVRDLAPLAAKEEKIKDLLTRNGFTVTLTPPPASE